MSTVLDFERPGRDVERVHRMLVAQLLGAANDFDAVLDGVTGAILELGARRTEVDSLCRDATSILARPPRCGPDRRLWHDLIRSGARVVAELEGSAWHWERRRGEPARAQC